MSIDGRLFREKKISELKSFPYLKYSKTLYTVLSFIANLSLIMPKFCDICPNIEDYFEFVFDISYIKKSPSIVLCNIFAI